MREVSGKVQRDFSVVVTKGFYKNLKYLLLINRWVGLFPISVYKKGDGYMLQWSWLKVILGNVIVLLIAVLTLWCTLASYSVEKVYDIRVKGLAALISNIAEIFMLFVTWMIGQWSISVKFKEFWTFLLYLLKIDDLMGQPDPSKKTWLLLPIILLTLTCLTLDAYMWAKLIIPFTGTFAYLWKCLPFYFPYAFVMILQVNFWITVREIKIRLGKFNGLISGFIHVTDARGKRVSRDGPRSRIEFLSNNGKVDFKDRAVTIKSFIKIYESIAKASYALNAFFGLSISVILFNIIICIVITPYVLYQQLFHSGEQTFLFTQSFWMICHILRMLLFVEPYHNAQLEGIKTKKLVIKLLLLDLPEDVHKEVKTLLVLINGNKIEFNANGMTSINRTLFPKIGGAVFTYLAILFQYKNSP
ncbi:gustatory receptor for sugar taste 43a-like [Anthonomus grandis grandis]|uniref:gustatory receptor for sugar taste 43a-like n=1 Tax=Anthonomus grandis grandis TaxID=2921223 RepID=UPI0021669CB7|nr:gustatory receptor for sugar taste 43a-like [Anthonomus grandis grandis]